MSRFHASGLPRPRILLVWFAVVAAAFVMTALLKAGKALPAPAPVAVGAVAYAGSQACASCHAVQTNAWAISHHAHAMDHARPQTMRGDFSGVTVSGAGSRARFYREGTQYRVETEGRDGRPAVFTISHSLGWEPLQQYLVTFPDGRLQVLPWAWDTRSSAEGGQRWFQVYGDEVIPPSDNRHWTRLQQNWNHMCAECHTTDLRKGYDPQEDRFRTTWSELGVGCESCHGPGGGHVRWALTGTADPDPLRGFASVAARRPAANWTPDPKTGSPAAAVGRPLGDEVETCARCHSRRGQIGTDWRPGHPITQTHSPVSLTAGLFEADGQMKDEVFNDHSFKQSLMYEKGVVCSDCHDPHSGKVRAQGAAICSQCHQPERFAAVAHTGHQPGPAAPDCIGCHMPSRTYMQVDRRHDHSFRIPRPDLAAATGSPNTCNACHTDRTANWAAEAIAKWHGPIRKGHQRYGTAFHKSRTGQPQAREMLQALAVDGDTPGLARATAIDELAAWPAAASDAAAAAGLTDPDPLVRAAAVRRLEGQPVDRRRAALPLLGDTVRLVRIAAGFLLADLATESLAAVDREALSAAVAEYEAAQAIDLDRPEARANLALLRIKQGRHGEAEGEFRAALKLEPGAAAIAVQLADLYRRKGHEAEAERTLRAVLTIDPGAMIAHHALGLSLIRQRRPGEALKALEAAFRGDAANARYAFVYGVALRSVGKHDDATRVLEAALALSPADADITSALLQEALKRGDAQRASGLLRNLMALRPDDTRLIELSRRLGR